MVAKSRGTWFSFFGRSVADGEKENNQLIDNGSGKQSNNQTKLGEVTQSNTNVDALFEALSRKGINFSSEVKKELRKAFEKAKDWNSLIEEIDPRRVKFIIQNIFENKELEKGIDKKLRQTCEQSVKQAKEIAAKHIEGAISCAYLTKDDKGLDVLNVHLDEPGLNKPIPISDILKVQGVVSELNIYGSSGKREVNAKRNEGGTRNYNFDEGANYLMTIRWPVKIGNSLAICNMSVNVNGNGITGIRDFEIHGIVANDPQISIEDLLKLAEQNKELLINGCPLVEECKRVLGFKASESFIRLDDSDNSSNPIKNSTMVDGKANQGDEQKNSSEKDESSDVDATKEVQESKDNASIPSDKGSVDANTVDSKNLKVVGPHTQNLLNKKGEEEKKAAGQNR